MAASVIPARWNITVRKGRDFVEQYDFQNDDGTPMDLTGYTVKAEMREAPSLDSPLIVAFSVSIPTPANGQVTLSLTDIQTAALGSYSKAYYDIMLTDPSGIDETYVEGTVAIKDSVTSNA